MDLCNNFQSIRKKLFLVVLVILVVYYNERNEFYCDLHLRFVKMLRFISAKY